MKQKKGMCFKCNKPTTKRVATKFVKINGIFTLIIVFYCPKCNEYRIWVKENVKLTGLKTGNEDKSKKFTKLANKGEKRFSSEGKIPIIKKRNILSKAITILKEI